MTLDLNPSTIALATFDTLLGAYETTVRQITRTKALATLNPKSKTKSNLKTNKTQTHKRTAPSEKEREEDLDSVSEQVREFLELDEWRYDVLPGLVADRRLDNERGGGGHLSREELVRLMEWKLYVCRPSPFRPTTHRTPVYKKWHL